MHPHMLTKLNLIYKRLNTTITYRQPKFTSDNTADKSSHANLVQRFSVSIQRGNAGINSGTLPPLNVNVLIVVMNAYILYFSPSISLV